jgi:dihydroxyacetone kinase-like predicted kinase
VVLTEALTYGPIISIKIDNMREQHSEAVSGAAEVQSDSPPQEMKEFGVVAVCAGAGIENVFRDLGADNTVTGGQTMNPSTEDILDKINATPSNVVFVLPNNKNIIMAAEQCIPLSSKRVVVIPTKSIPQGVSALLAIDGAESAEGIADCMADAAKNVHTALITTASRDSVFDDLTIKKGEHLAMIDDSLTACGLDIDDVIDAVASAISGFSSEFITIYTGEDTEEAGTANVMNRIGSALPSAEITVINGGQPVYNYIISAE